MTSRRKIIATAVGVFLVAACDGGPPATTPSRPAPDPGIAACLEAVSSFRSGAGALTEATVSGWRASANPDLSAAAATILRIKALPPDQQAAENQAIVEAVQQIGTGCAAVGAPLPPDMVPSD